MQLAQEGCQQHHVSERAAAHDERALLIAKHYGIDAIAYAADDVAFQYAERAHIHEWLAQMKVVLDLFVLNTKPRYLGAKEAVH